jgi:hypothetical protein
MRDTRSQVFYGRDVVRIVVMIIASQYLQGELTIASLGCLSSCRSAFFVGCRLSLLPFGLPKAVWIAQTENFSYSACYSMLSPQCRYCTTEIQFNFLLPRFETNENWKHN